MIFDLVVFQRALAKRAPQIRLIVLESIGSTNAELMQRAQAGAAIGTCILAERQLAGRGRQGRAWLSDPQGSLTFSLLWDFEGPPQGLTGLPLVVSLAVLESLERLGIDGLSLKWPNDLLRHGLKLAGILVELTPCTAETQRAVIGIGLNLAIPESLRDRLDVPVADLTSKSRVAPARETVLAELLVSLVETLGIFSAQGFLPFQGRWYANSIHRDRPVKLTLPSRTEIRGLSVGLSAEGGLILEQEGRRNTYHGGNLSLRWS